MPEQFGNNEAGSPRQGCPLTGQMGSPPAKEEEETESHWIEIELVGDDDKPIPMEPYCITLPDGVEVHGYLDREGRARVTGIPQGGNCKVSFTELDTEAWEPA
jgi:hypothetical protein